jgi:hypothetical protein
VIHIRLISHSLTSFFLKNVYFISESIQQFIKSIQMIYLHGGRRSEVHVSTPNGSSSGAESKPNMDPYCRVVLRFDIELVTRSSKLKLKLID